MLRICTLEIVGDKRVDNTSFGIKILFTAINRYAQSINVSSNILTVV